MSTKLEQVPKINELPEYSEENFYILRDKVFPKLSLNNEEDREVEGTLENTVDTVIKFWRDHSPSYREQYRRLRTATEAKELVKYGRLEVRDASEYAVNTYNNWEQFRALLQDAVDGKPVGDHKLHEMHELANRFYAGIHEDDQAIALLEILPEAKELGLTIHEVRQIMAQQAVGEFLNSATYDTMASSRSRKAEPTNEFTTQDHLEDEKQELRSALRRGLWDEETTNQAETIFFDWIEVAENDSNNVDNEVVVPDMEELWRRATGQGIARTSALYNLQLGQDIYLAMDEGGAFEGSLPTPDIDLFTKF